MYLFIFGFSLVLEMLLYTPTTPSKFQALGTSISAVYNFHCYNNSRAQPLYSPSKDGPTCLLDLQQKSGQLDKGHAATFLLQVQVRYPTNEKLLWESVEWSYRQLKAICKALGIKTPRTKYLKWQRCNISYSKMRRKTKSKRRRLDRSLLLLLDKIDGELGKLEKDYKLQMPEKYRRRRATIKKIYTQQHQIFHTGEKPKGRIVSIGKNYLRPIVRGKEIKPVEFGAKANKFQIDGISFIEHLNFNAFHEGNRFQDTIFKAQRLTRTKTRLAGADAIYATNKNRKFAAKYNIRTDFKRKGRAGKHERQRKQMAAMITKERATRLEGSFGKEKEHYRLKKIKARTRATETLWIFFGIHTANALEIGRRMAKALQQVA